MLKQAMTKLEFLNNEIMTNFDIPQWKCSKAFKEFKSFTEELIPCVLRELRQENPLGLPPWVVELLGDCVHKSVKEVPDQCALCSDALNGKRSIDVYVQDIDLVHELQSGISRWSAHMTIKNRYDRKCLCSDTHYIQSELRSVEAICGRITTRISGIFHNDHITQCALPPSIRKSAVFIPDYQGFFHEEVLTHRYIDCLGRNHLHRYFDGLVIRDRSWIPGDVKTSLESHAHLRTEIDILGRSPLHIAMGKNIFFTELFCDLLCTPAVNMQTVYGHIPLHYLAFKTEGLTGHSNSMPKNLPKSEIYQHLNEYVLDVNDRSALSLVMQHSSTSRVKFFLENFCMNINSRDAYTDDGPLMEAIMHNRTDVVHHLLRLPVVDANVAQYGTRETPLHFAIRNESLLSLELLGNWNGLKWDKTNKFGQMALHLAAGIPDDDRFLKYLLEHQQPIDINARDGEGLTTLHYAAEGAAAGNISLLLEVDGVEVNTQDFEEQTPLICLIRMCRDDFDYEEGIADESVVAIKTLMRDMRVDPNIPDKNGDTVFTVTQELPPSVQNRILPYLLRESSLYAN